MSRHTPPSPYGRPESRRPHYIYRCYDADGSLLYVGCSSSPLKRIEDHRVNSWWGNRIESARYTVFPYREYALDIEREAILNERPACNVKNRWYIADPRADWSLDDYRTFRYAVIRTARGHVGLSTARLIERIDAEVNTRFGVTLIAASA